MNEFKVGDVVRLRSGGLPFTIRAVGPGVVCMINDTRDLEHISFACLQLVDPVNGWLAKPQTKVPQPGEWTEKEQEELGRTMHDHGGGINPWDDIGDDGRADCVRGAMAVIKKANELRSKVQAGVPSVEELAEIGAKAYETHNAYDSSHIRSQIAQTSAIRDAVLAGVEQKPTTVPAKVFQQMSQDAAEMINKALNGPTKLCGFDCGKIVCMVLETLGIVFVEMPRTPAPTVPETLLPPIDHSARLTGEKCKMCGYNQYLAFGKVGCLYGCPNNNQTVPGFFVAPEPFSDPNNDAQPSKVWEALGWTHWDKRPESIRKMFTEAVAEFKQITLDKMFPPKVGPILKTGQGTSEQEFTGHEKA